MSATQGSPRASGLTRPSTAHLPSVACRWRPRPPLQQLRWMLEEFRVSLHAQELRTLVPVSEKRLQEQIERILHP